MKKSKRFTPIVDLAHDAERKAAESLGASLKKYEQAINRLSDLKQYHNEYVRQFSLVGKTGMPSAKAVDYRLFLEKLKQAIEQQEKSIEQALLDLDRSKAFWFSQRGRSKALDNVLARYVADERKIQEKREQIEQDERNSREPANKTS
ncbi:MAG: flagellar export protein FliJ [Gammaproteobacteria bacterium]|nr:flagellar export protein FliJ [Gammaproteobacteria bacterium]